MSVDQRTAYRCPVRIPVFYWGDDFLGDGTVVSVSPSSLCIVGNYVAVSGRGMRLMLCLPDDREPLYVYRAVVRWTRGMEFGVELLTMTETARARLDTFIACVILPSHVPHATDWPWEDSG